MRLESSSTLLRSPVPVSAPWHDQAFGAVHLISGITAQACEHHIQLAVGFSHGTSTRGTVRPNSTRTAMSTFQETSHTCTIRVHLDGMVVGPVAVLVRPARAALVLPLDVGPDAAQIGRQLWQLCIGDEHLPQQAPVLGPMLGRQAAGTTCGGRSRRRRPCCGTGSELGQPLLLSVLWSLSVSCQQAGAGRMARARHAHPSGTMYCCSGTDQPYDSASASACLLA